MWPWTCWPTNHRFETVEKLNYTWIRIEYEICLRCNKKQRWVMKNNEYLEERHNGW